MSTNTNISVIYTPAELAFAADVAGLRATHPTHSNLFNYTQEPRNNQEASVLPLPSFPTKTNPNSNYTNTPIIQPKGYNVGLFWLENEFIKTGVTTQTATIASGGGSTFSVPVFSPISYGELGNISGAVGKSIQTSKKARPNQKPIGSPFGYLNEYR